ncbi:probable protein phosphatase 2C F42G9.1, partial [Asparagus officinalis]|uniref:probable protein phosphatase 2C F42G9.1 n=1 Tax=Asparagus officinalis TaxID=4686 RepID=UPI00098E0B87
ATNPNARPPVSAAEQARVSATLVQQTALKSSRAFFSKDGSDDDEMNEDEDDDDEEESRALEFFVGVFDKDDKLREYYAKHYEKGDFFCLVCEGIRVKLGRRYVDCVGLVQHSIAITKTKRRGAHRGFGRAVCRVLGWDIKRLPNIILDHSEPMVDSLVKEGKMQNDVRKDDADEVLTDCIKEKRIETLDEEDVNNEKVDIPTHLEVSKEERKGKETNLPAAEIVLRPCNPNQGQTPDATGLERNTPLQKQTPLAEEQAKVNAAAVQQKVLKACQNFLAKSDASSSSEDEDDDKNEVEKRESVALKFYSGLFSMNPELKNYYEKNHVKGEFFCLVCAAIGKRTWKRFGDCNGLVQHSLSIANTKRKWAHRAFGKAICQVLGYDVNENLTVIIAPKESQAQPLEKPANTG